MHALPMSLPFPLPLQRLLKVSVGLLTGLLVSAAAQAQPVITAQPVQVIAYETQTVQFMVEATGQAPLGYQWRAGDTNILAGTNSVLVLTNATVAEAGLYRVVVTNAAGSVTSDAVALFILPRPFPFVSFGSFVPGPTPEVPVQYTAFGTETTVRFSVAYNTNALGNPRFISTMAGSGGVAPTSVRGARPAVEGDPGVDSPTLITTNDPAGSFGVEIRLGGGAVFPPGLNALGRVQWDALGAGNPYGVGLVLTNVPVPLAGSPLGGTNGVVGSLPIGPVTRVIDTPVLDFQSGLFLQRIELGNPGVRTQEQVRISALNLTNDSQGNRIRMYNALGTNAAGQDSLFLSSLLPGEQRRLRVEFYVSDLMTVPAPDYGVEEIGPIGPPPLTQRVVAVDSARYFTNAAYPTGAFVVVFPTEAGRRYLVQYAPTVEALSMGSVGIRTAQPAVMGTGSKVQWIDEGPPKTESVPAEGSRFYRVILGQ